MSDKKDTFYIRKANLPPRMPLTATAFWWMFLDYINAPEWAFGAVGFAVFVAWVDYLHKMTTKKEKDVFEG